MERIGFIGTGRMGSGMAANLVRAGHEVTVWNRTRAKAEAIDGVEVAASPEDVAGRCSVVMICVSDTPDLREVVEGDGGILSSLGDGSLVVDHSTVSPSATRDLAGRVEAAGAAWVDAPVSGGPEGADRGTLSIMVGGESGPVERARPLMETYGSSVIHVGEVGAGQTVKLVNQVLVVINQWAASEALLLAEAAGVDLEKALTAVEGGAAGSWMLSNRGPQMIQRDWRPGFTVDLQQKDLRLVLQTADELGLSMPGTAVVYQMYRALQRRGLGEEGNHALVKALEELAGVEIGGGSP